VSDGNRTDEPRAGYYVQTHDRPKWPAGRMACTEAADPDDAVFELMYAEATKVEGKG
jgi:hypothetical protein